jgi:hypothetical protein
MEEFQETYEMLDGLMVRLRNECKKYLETKLNDHHGNIKFSDMDDSVCVTYDGGNHPEYASNAFSEVHGVFRRGNKIYLNTEDCDEYEIDRVDTLDLFGVCDFISNM